jgi:hypothetical protein
MLIDYTASALIRAGDSSCRLCLPKEYPSPAPVRLLVYKAFVRGCSVNTTVILQMCYKLQAANTQIETVLTSIKDQFLVLDYE